MAGSNFEFEIQFRNCGILQAENFKCEARYECLDRQALYGFIMRMKDPCGGFRMHDMGELDMRGTYCAIAVRESLTSISQFFTIFRKYQI